MNCASQDPHPKKSIPRRGGKLGTIHTVKFSPNTLHHKKKNRERKGPLQGTIQRCESHERSPCAPKFTERSQEKPCNKKDAPAESHGTWRKYLQAQGCRQKQRFTILLKPGQCRRPLHNYHRNGRGIIQKCAPHERSPCAKIRGNIT